MEINTLALILDDQLLVIVASIYIYDCCLLRNGCQLQKGESNTPKQQKVGVLNLVALWTQDKGS